MSGHRRFEDLNHKGTPETLAGARVELDRVLRVAELRAEFDVDEQQAWRMLAAERGEIPVDRVAGEA